MRYTKELLTYWVGLGGPMFALNMACLEGMKKAGRVSDDFYEEIMMMLEPGSRWAERCTGWLDYYLSAILVGVPYRSLRLYEEDSEAARDGVLKGYEKAFGSGWSQYLAEAVAEYDREQMPRNVGSVDEMLEAGYTEDELIPILELGLSVGKLRQRLLPVVNRQVQIEEAMAFAESEEYQEKLRNGHAFPKEKSEAITDKQAQTLLKKYGEGTKQQIRNYVSAGYGLEVITEALERKLTATQTKVLSALRLGGVSDDVVSKLLLWTPMMAAKRAVRFAEWVVTAYAWDVGSGVADTETALVRNLLSWDAPPADLEVEHFGWVVLENIFGQLDPDIDLFDRRKRGQKIRLPVKA